MAKTKKKIIKKKVKTAKSKGGAKKLVEFLNNKVVINDEEKRKEVEQAIDELSNISKKYKYFIEDMLEHNVNIKFVLDITEKG